MSTDLVADSIRNADADTALIACHDCDLLLREKPLPPGSTARCSRCGAELYRNRTDSLNRTLAYTLGALMLFGITNAFPIVGLQVGGEVVQTTLFGAVRSLYEQDMRLVAAVVFVTTLATPAIELGALVYLLLPLKFNHVPDDAARVFRALHRAIEWSMVEVFMLGVLVALVKLAHIAAVVPGIALWSFAALMLLLAAALSTFDPRAMWARLGKMR